MMMDSLTQQPQLFVAISDSCEIVAFNDDAEQIDDTCNTVLYIAQQAYTSNVRAKGSHEGRCRNIPDLSKVPGSLQTCNT